MRIGQMQVKNRMVMPPMGTNLCDEQGYVTTRLKDYYQARAIGGIGLIIVEGACIDTRGGKTVNHQMVIDHDRFLPGLRELTGVIHNGGAKVAIQLMHPGVAALPHLTSKPWAPAPGDCLMAAIRMK